MNAARALYIDTHAPRGAARKGLDLWIAEFPGGMPLAEALPILRAVAGLLATSHAVRQLFRTLTPAELAYDSLTRTVGLDLTRVIPGRDLRYASPEVIEDRPPNVRDDVFSFACIAYELLGGKHPYGGGLASEALASGVTVAPIQNLTAAQNAALARGLALERSRRTETVGHLMRELLMPSAAPDGIPRNVVYSMPAEGLPRRGLVGLGLACAGIALVGAGLFAAFNHGTNDRSAAVVATPATSAIVPAPIVTDPSVTDPNATDAKVIDPPAADTASAASTAAAPAIATPPAVDPAMVRGTRVQPAPARESAAATVTEPAPTTEPVMVARIEPPPVTAPVEPAAAVVPVAVVNPAVAACPSCDCTELRDRRSFTNELLRANELAYLRAVCR